MTTGRIIRYTFAERIVHAFAALSYLYLLLTGLAFWTPALYWLTAITGGGYRARILHPWVGLLFTASVVWMYFIWHRDMRVTAQDRSWRKAMIAYISHDDVNVPPAGRFNYGQKMLFWLMAGGGIVLLFSGLVMWFVASASPELRGASTILHALAALATIAGFIVHIYMGVAVVPGGVHAIVHGDVSERWAEHHHPLWFAERRASKR